MEIRQVCRNCGDTFIIPDKEQKWYANKGFKLPKNCFSCRAAKREENRHGEKEEN